MGAGVSWVEQLGNLSRGHHKVIIFYDPIYQLYRCNIGLHIRAQGQTLAEAIADAWGQHQNLRGGPHEANTSQAAL